MQRDTDVTVAIEAEVGTDAAVGTDVTTGSTIHRGTEVSQIDDEDEGIVLERGIQGRSQARGGRRQSNGSLGGGDGPGSSSGSQGDGGGRDHSDSACVGRQQDVTCVDVYGQYLSGILHVCSIFRSPAYRTGMQDSALYRVGGRSNSERTLQY